VVQLAVEHGGDGRVVAKQFSPVLDRAPLELSLGARDDAFRIGSDPYLQISLPVQCCQLTSAVWKSRDIR